MFTTLGLRYRLASTLHDAYSDLGPSHLLIIRILTARRFDFNNVHFFASASATASKSTRTLLRTLPLDHLPAALNHTCWKMNSHKMAANTDASDSIKDSAGKNYVVLCEDECKCM